MTMVLDNPVKKGKRGKFLTQTSYVEKTSLKIFRTKSSKVLMSSKRD